ncbi:hypothetical protein D5P86_00435 [Salmonella enterica subsp. enterica serovar Infantis]|nr:hypothetical protein [Salmonella enterica subsp. enterica serovar Infantis]
MSNANAKLLNARVRRLDGTITFINKVNANGYSTDAKGPQIPVKRIVLAGKTLKEIEAPFAKAEHVLIDGITVKLNKRQQKDLRNDEIDVDTIKPDFGSLVYIDPETGKPAVKTAKVKSGVKATRERNKDKRTKKERKAEVKASNDTLDMLPSAKVDRKAEMIQTLDATIADANSKERRKLLSETFDMDWKDIKKHGGAGVMKHLGRKAVKTALDRLSATVTGDAYIKQMPTELKRLIQDGVLTLNKKQIERVLDVFGLDAQFYATAVQTLLGNMKLVLDKTVYERPAKTKQKKVKAGKPTYASEKEDKRRVKKMTYKLLAPTKSHLKEAKAQAKATKAVIAKKLGIDPKEVKRGLLVYKPNGVELMFVACDQTGPVFIDKDGNESMSRHDHVASTFDYTLTKTSELDAAV